MWQTGTSLGTGRFVRFCALVAAWLWLHAAALDWLSDVFVRESAHAALLCLLGTIAVALARRDGGLRWSLSPVCDPVALAAVVAGSTGYMWAERALGIEIVSASLTALSAWGLITSYFPERRRLTALLLFAALPIGAYLDAYVAFPARMFSARQVAGLLSWFGLSSVSATTVIELDSGIAHIDAPCSGVKSLWTGLLFYLAATWVARVHMGFRWLATGALFAAALCGVNTLRIAFIVTLALVLDLPAVAEVVHLPLGIVGFSACGAAVLGAVRGMGCRPLPVAGAPSALGRRAQLVLIVWLSCLSALYSPGADVPQPSWFLQLPAELQAEALALTDDELAFFARRGPTAAVKNRISHADLTGSMMAAYSRTWRAHHNPEHCLAANGHRVGRRVSTLVAPDFSVRMVEVGAARTAFYWLQSPRRTTDDIGARIWADVAAGEDRWVLVSILLDRPPAAPLSTDTVTLLSLIREAVERSLQGELA